MATVIPLCHCETVQNAELARARKELLGLDEYKQALDMIAKDPHTPKRVRDIAALGLRRGHYATQER